jgi:hypothetical protein
MGSLQHRKFSKRQGISAERLSGSMHCARNSKEFRDKPRNFVSVFLGPDISFQAPDNLGSSKKVFFY